jgi:hypothetical protein
MTHALHLVFVCPRFLLDTADIVIAIDGAIAVQSGFAKGVDATFPVTPGHHVIDVKIDLGGLLSRKRRYELDVAGPTRLELKYSRMWGNFTRAPVITANA